MRFGAASRVVGRMPYQRSHRCLETMLQSLEPSSLYRDSSLWQDLFQSSRSMCLSTAQTFAIVPILKAAIHRCERLPAAGKSKRSFYPGSVAELFS